MTWMQEFWKKIFPEHNQEDATGKYADVILIAMGPNISHVTHVVRSLTGLGISEINFYLSKTPVRIFSNLPIKSAYEVAQTIQSTGASVEIKHREDSI